MRACSEYMFCFSHHVGVVAAAKSTQLARGSIRVGVLATFVADFSVVVVHLLGTGNPKFVCCKSQFTLEKVPLPSIQPISRFLSAEAATVVYQARHC